MLNKYLDLIIKHDASDLHISSNNPAIIRVNGTLTKINNNNLDKDFILNKIIKEILPAKKFKLFIEHNEIDHAISYQENIRFRINCFYNNNGPAISIRMLSNVIPPLSDLTSDKIFYDLCELKNGLIIVSGATGAGKSTTLASMIEYINQNFKQNIITIEDPIEYIYQSKKSLINQKEVGENTKSFNESIRSTLRQDPDIVIIGEIRDLETMRLALTIAETGHLVFATLHTNSAYNAINRMIDIFPDHDKDTIRSSLSLCLRAIICQRLIKTKKGSRCAAFEIMISNSAVTNLIRNNQIHNLNSIIEIGSKDGMISMRKYLERLVEDDIISEDEI